MPEIARFECALVEKDLGYGRKVRLAVDAETGEVMCEQYLCDIDRAFAAGANVAAKTLTVSREVTPYGAVLLTFTDYEDDRNPKIIGRAWIGRKQRQREARKHARLAHGWFLEAGQGLDDAALGALVRITAHADRKTKTLPSLSRLAKLVKCDRTTLYRRISELLEAGLLGRDDKGRLVLKERGEDGREEEVEEHVQHA